MEVESGWCSGKGGDMKRSEDRGRGDGRCGLCSGIGEMTRKEEEEVATSNVPKN